MTRNKGENPVWPLFAGALILHALNMAVISPYVGRIRDEPTGNAVFIAFHVVIIVGFAAMVALKCGRTPLQTLGWSALVEFGQQVPIKGLWLLHLAHENPQEWAGLTSGRLLMILFGGFAVFLPIVMIVAFVGASFGAKLRGKA